jgi:hypothetical protein
MSKEPRITTKSLNYDKTLPPFLARLQASASSGPSTYQSARPQKPRNAQEDAEDEPVVFDEATGSTLTKAEWELKEKEEEEGGEKEVGKVEERKEVDGKVEKTAVIGSSRKRKVGKVVGEAEAEDADVTPKKVEDKEAGKKAEKAKGAKKAKKVKLSFGDDD